MTSEEVSNHPHMSSLRTAYMHFRNGDAHAAMEVLAPVLDAADPPSVVSATIWGLAGDCFFALSKIEHGFTAYRQAMTLDPSAGCLSLFVHQVVRHRRIEDAAFARQCLDAAWAADRLAFRQHPVHFLKHSFKPELLHFRCFVLLYLRWRLRRLALRSANPNL